MADSSCEVLGLKFILLLLLVLHLDELFSDLSSAVCDVNCNSWPGQVGLLLDFDIKALKYHISLLLIR